MPICKMHFSQELFDSYGKVLELIYNTGLNIFYRDDSYNKIDANEIKVKQIQKVVEKKKYMFQEGMSHFTFNYCFVKKLLYPANLPLSPCKQVLPFVLESWNIMKLSRDMITQMIWDVNYHPPANNAQTALLFSTPRPFDSFCFILSYRDAVQKNLLFWKSIRHLTLILCIMLAEYNPECPLPSAAMVHNQMATPNGIPVWHGNFPRSGTSP
eukprot:1182519-Ditylum_brightwellii.AAC.1